MEVPILSESKASSSEIGPKEKSSNVTESSLKIVQCKSKKSIAGGGGYGTGKRKDAVARVWVKPGQGVVTVNNKDYSQYFPRDSYRAAIIQPFIDTKTDGQFDVVCTVKGGGMTGQSGAIIHGIARALDCISDDHHDILHKNGFLTRDSRVVERKKYGKRKARKSTQFSKR